MASQATGEFAIGDVLSQGFLVFFANIVPFGLISLVIFIPYMALLLIAAHGGIAADGRIIDAVTRIFVLLLSYFVTGAVAYGTFNHMRGRPIGTSECLSRGLAVMVPVVGVAIVTGLAVLLGLIALIIPGLFLLTVLWVAVPVAVVERPGVFASLSRSAQLTEGKRMSIFGILVILVLINLGVGLVFGVVFGLIISGSGGQSQGVVTAILIVSAALEALLTALGAVMTTVGYHDLRAAKEGISIEDIVKVFD